jgi:fatty-acyl-CoA synthase
MRNEGLGSWPARRARKTPHRTALIHQDRATSYAALHERTTRLAHALRAAGIRRGDRVAYLGPNHPSYLETLFATGVLGAVFVPLNARLAGPEIAYQLADSGAKALIHPSSQAVLVDGIRGETDVRVRIVVDGDYEERLAAASDEPIDEQIGLDDTCIVMYTSGTTGRPKGAMLSHSNLTWNAFNVLVDQDVATDETALVSAPLFHTAGLNMLTLPVLLKGGTCVLVEAFDPGATLDLIERHRITFMFGVPAMFDQVARHPRWAEADLSSCACSAAADPRSRPP